LDLDVFTKNATSLLNHQDSEICTFVERQFLKTLEGGCTAPIGALATIENETIYFKGALFSLDGTQKLIIEETIEKQSYFDFGKHCAQKILNNGGIALMESIKKSLSKN
jgi:hydroxymethylbilane synthase